MTKIKICGLSRDVDIEVVNKYKPDYIGFVFYPPSKRNVSKEQAVKLKSLLHEGIEAVGVFVDLPKETIADIVNSGAIDVVQLHGHEDNIYIRELKKLIPENTMIIQAFKIRDYSDIEKANESIADKILLDNGLGTGECFDWSVIENVKKEFFLAGGLSVDNVGIAIDKVHPYAVDISSKVETDGYKDEEKIRQFCEAVRLCD